MKGNKRKDSEALKRIKKKKGEEEEEEEAMAGQGRAMWLVVGGVEIWSRIMGELLALLQECMEK